MLNLDVAIPQPHRPTRCGCSQSPIGHPSAREVAVSLCRRHSSDDVHARLLRRAERIGLETLLVHFAA